MTAWQPSRELVVKGDVVAEFPMYTRNYVQEGGGIQLGQPDAKREGGKERKEAEVRP